MSASASITFACTWFFFSRNEEYIHSIFMAHLSRISDLTNQIMIPIRYHKWAASEQSGQAPPPLFLLPGHALLTSLVDFLFRPAPLKVSIETAVENYYGINNSCYPIRVEWFPDKSIKILKFSNCREILPLRIIVLKFVVFCSQVWTTMVVCHLLQLLGSEKEKT